MDKKLKEDNIQIAKYLGYTYVPWNTKDDYEPGWQILETHPSLRSLYYLCRHHIDLNFHSDIRRSELILSTLKRYGYGYVIDNSCKSGLIVMSLHKPHTEPIVHMANSIPEVVYNSVLEIIKHHTK